MSHSNGFVSDEVSLPEDGLDDVEFEQYLEDGNHLQRQHSTPTAFTKRISDMMGEALSMCQSFVRKSSAIDYIETARSFLGRVNTEENDFRNIVTGGAADGWYPASAPSAPLSPPLSPVPLATPTPSQPSCVGAVVCFAPMMPVPAPMSTCAVSTNQLIVPSPASDAGPTLLGNKAEVVQQTKAQASCQPSAVQAVPASQRTPLRSTACEFAVAPTSQRTPLRSAAAVFQPVSQEQKEDTPPGQVPPTTLMLRNIPTTISRDMVMRLLEVEGLAKHVVFVYLPMNLRTSGNFGYAFVDFDSTNVAEQCKKKLDGCIGFSESTGKALEVVWSETQGLDSHVQRYRDSPLMHESLEDEFKPAIFKNGLRIAFPPPTKPIRAPRLRRTPQSAIH